MKKLSLVLLLCLSASLTYSQEVSFRSGQEKHNHKPALFTQTAAKSAVQTPFLEEMLNYTVGQQVKVVLAGNVRFTGTVTARTSDAPGLLTIMVHSADVNGLVFSISRIQVPGAAVEYRGMLMSMAHSDMLMLEKDPVTGTYAWNKKQVSRMLAD
ncbi:MAG TPA: hypothetical protein PKE63_09780 [Lacibacter sp.]|nr:hypothetical protein [Lacibacter sp.]HMO88487.1 hypothetical protein [Lacibacter sp.]HMP87555.1 hypothetical protein [Lacibacter sp.]